MARLLTLASLVVPAVLLSCGGETPPPAAPPVAPPSPTVSSADPAPTATVATPPPEAPKPAAPPPAVKYTGLSTPESVLYDDQADRYLVSNINGGPIDTDNNGFIAALTPDGQVANLKWIEGGKKNVKLDAPKGMAIVKGTLYVADISTVRLFDVKTGAPKGEVKIAGSTFLNDVAAGPDGKVYVSDSGVKPGANGFDPTGTDAVYVLDKGKAKAIAKTTDLGRPNGLLVTDKGLLVDTFGSGEIYRLDDKGAKQDATKPPKGGLDGLVAVGDTLVVSSWEGSAIYRGKLGGTFDLAIPEQKAPADIGYDTKRGRVLVPHFMDGTVEGYDLK